MVIIVVVLVVIVSTTAHHHTHDIYKRNNGLLVTAHTLAYSPHTKPHIKLTSIVAVCDIYPFQILWECVIYDTQRYCHTLPYRCAVHVSVKFIRRHNVCAMRLSHTKDQNVFDVLKIIWKFTTKVKLYENSDNKSFKSRFITLICGNICCVPSNSILTIGAFHMLYIYIRVYHINNIDGVPPRVK